MVQTLGPGGGIERRRHAQIQHAAHRAHEVNDGVGPGAQGLGGHVGHEGHRRRAVGAHGDEQQAQHDNKAHQLEGGGLGGIAVVQDGQQVHEDHRRPGARQDEGGPAAHPGLPAPVGETAEQGQQEQSQNVVRRHDDAGEGLVHVEGSAEDQGHQIVVHLPEGADREKGQPHQDGALVVQLQLIHGDVLLL